MTIFLGWNNYLVKVHVGYGDLFNFVIRENKKFRKMTNKYYAEVSQ